MKQNAETERKQNDQSPPLFLGGSRTLTYQYSTIGAALLSYEEASINPFCRIEACDKHFGESVAFVPVEVLESYLDDLIDVTIPDESLFVEQQSLPLHGKMLLVAAYTAIALLLFVLMQGRLVLFAVSMLSLSAVFFFAWRRSSRNAVRRLSLARPLFKEINRRRGREEGPLIPLAQWKELFSNPHTEGSLPGAACGLWQ